MLDVALIGLGNDWSTRFRPALQNLQKRLRIRGVYTSVSTLAEQAAADFRCPPSSGIAALVSRSNIRGVLILDPGICPLFAIELAARFGKPAFLAPSTLEMARNRREFHEGLQSGDAFLMPSCEWRYHPATTRLRELLATRLGRPHEIRISVTPSGSGSLADKPSPAQSPAEIKKEQATDSANDLPAESEPTLKLWELFDWCRFLLGTRLHSLQALPASGTEGRQTIHLEFLPSVSGGTASRASIECPVDPAGLGHLPKGAACQVEVHALQGRAILSGPTDIAWENATEHVTESLEKDRCASEVMLDHFARRALGGLIPVANLEDVSLAHDLVTRADESLRTRRPVLLHG